MLVKKIKIRLLFVICAFFVPLLGVSQGGPPPPGDDPPLPLPIDDNCILLLAAGLFLALYTIRESRRKAVNSKNRPEKILVHNGLLIKKGQIMKKIVKMFFLLVTFSSFSQIYFSPNSYIYVKNQLLYVNQDIDLQQNSTLYLRNQSQLVQGTTGISANKGIGSLSVYQEGTSDNFDYNYWCSPIGNASAITGNENFGVTMLNRPTSSTASTPATILAQASRDGTANPLSIAARWIYKLTNANSYSQWIYVGNNTTIAPGEGFTMKGTSGTDSVDAESNGVQNNSGGNGAQRYDFRGKPNDGNITVTLGTNNATLTGNPYPSALHLNAFLLDTDNTVGTGIAYFWEQDRSVNSHLTLDYRGGYGSYSPISLGSSGVYVPATFNSYNSDGSLNTTGTSSGLVIERKYSPIGQGFLLNGATNGIVTLKNSHRAYYKEGNPQTKFERRANKTSGTKESISQVSYLKLNVILNDQFTKQMALVLSPDATDGLDRGIDALSMNTTLPNDVYFFLNGANYVIQGINFEAAKKISLGVKAKNASVIKFYIPEVVNFNPSQEIYIYDSLDDSYHDIKNNMYEATVAPGVYNDRFKIVFKDEKKLNTEENLKKKELIISQNNATQLLTIFNENQVKLKSATVYDMSGKTVLLKKKLGMDYQYSFSTSGLRMGIYIIELAAEDGTQTIQKIFISNSGK
nr:T9SS type A sorting domain-containing protein [uncultured Flavobacterium sp.]